jgi:hypothetical protein
LGICIPIRTPAAAASAEPSANRLASPGLQDEEAQEDHEDDRDRDDRELLAGQPDPGDEEIGARRERREELRVRPENELRRVLDEQGDADRCDEERQPRRPPDRPVGEALDEDADDGAEDHRAEHDEEGAHERRLAPLQLPRKVVPGVGAQHVNVAVREVDEPQHAVDHGVAERDQGVDRPQGEAVDELLEKRRHLGTDPNFPSSPAEPEEETEIGVCPL